MKKVGNFVYKEDSDKVYLKFESSGDIPRVFTAVNYYAYDAGGIIGTEKNGVAILDNGTQEFSDMFVAASDIERGSLFGQAATMEALKSMDWVEFRDYLNSLGEYRDNVMDVSEEFEVPEEGNAINLHALGVLDLKEEKDLRTPEMIAVNDNPDISYEFPKIGRVGIITELMNHSVHRDGHYGKFYLSWNAKIDMNIDNSGKAGDFEVDPQFDEKWEEYMEENGSDVFYSVCEDMARYYVEEGLYSTYPGDDSGDYELGLQGRSGGNLVLRKMDGHEIGFDSYSDVQKVLNDLDDADLIKLYKVTKSLDADITKPKLKSEFEYQLSFRRNQMEEEWKMELEDNVKMDI